MRCIRIIHYAHRAVLDISVVLSDFHLFCIVPSGKCYIIVARFGVYGSIRLQRERIWRSCVDKELCFGRNGHICPLVAVYLCYLNRGSLVIAGKVNAYVYAFGHII